MDITLECTVIVNGVPRTRHVPARESLADFLREDLGLTGTHLGCEQGVCGACSVLMNGRSVRSCLVLAVQASGHDVVTIEGLEDNVTAKQFAAALSTEHGLQCGFCTPGIIVTGVDLLGSTAHLTEPDVREALSGNVCRCTGYQAIVAAVLSVASDRASLAGDGDQASEL